MKARIRRFFERARHTYAQAAQVQALAAAQCAASVPPGRYGRVLEIGAGAGLLARELAGRIDWGLYAALDLTPGMLAFGWEDEKPLARVAADGEAPPFRPGTFDLLASSSALQWFERPETTIPACLDLLKPGGRFALSLFTRGTLAELAEASAETGFGSTLPLRPGRFYTNLLESLPGIAVTSRVLEWTTRHEGVREFLLSLRRAGTQHSPEKRPFSRRRYEEFCRLYQERFGDEDGTVTATYRAVLAWGERRP